MGGGEGGAYSRKARGPCCKFWVIGGALIRRWRLFQAGSLTRRFTVSKIIPHAIISGCVDDRNLCLAFPDFASEVRSNIYTTVILGTGEERLLGEVGA